MQYVDYQHMIVNEINEIYLVLILFTCIYKYHIFKLFPIYLMNFHISRFFLNNNVFWSLICKYVYSTINTFFWKIFNLSNIYTTINTNFPNFFHFFFYQIPQVNLLHVPVYNCNFFFEIVQVSTLCTQNIFVTSRIVSIHIFATSHLKCIQLLILDFVLNILPE